MVMRGEKRCDSQCVRDLSLGDERREKMCLTVCQRP